jgi:4-amino-4-deoxy-L-arabinose transferase-like glycosyltransferase
MDLAAGSETPTSTAQTDAAERRGLSSHRFAWTLAAIALAAFLIRVWYLVGAHRARVMAPRPGPLPGGDGFFYHATANQLVEGRWFISPFFHQHVQAAEHPPLYSIFLGVPSLFGLRSVAPHLVWSCLLGAGTVVLVGVIGRTIGSPRTGLIAAVIAAVYPNMWVPDGGLQAETLAMFLTALAVLFAYACYERPSARKFIVLGAVCGLGALTRSELVLLVVFLLLPVALATRAVPVRERFIYALIGTLAACVVIAPWSVYNGTRFAHPVILSSQLGPMLASANCDSTYYGALQGYFDIQCTRRVDERAGLTSLDDESEVDRVDRHAAWHYVSGHVDHLPNVAFVRSLRLVGLYHPSSFVRTEAYVESRPLNISRAVLVSFYAMALLAIAGVLVLRRDRKTIPRFPLLAPIALVFGTTLFTYANTRFRAIAEPSLVVLGAVAIEAGLVRLTGRAREPAVPSDSLPPAAP